MTTHTHKVGDRVTFKPGPKATANVTAKVTGHDGPFLVTQDDAGKTRKVRAGAATKA